MVGYGFYFAGKLRIIEICMFRVLDYLKVGHKRVSEILRSQKTIEYTDSVIGLPT